MKKLVMGSILLSLFVGQQIFAATKISCENSEFSIEISVDSGEAQTPESNYKIYNNQQKIVKQGSLVKQFEGFEGSFLDAYVWIFVDGEDSISVATQDFQSPKSGVWSGKSDVAIDTSEGLFSGFSMKCSIEIVN